MAFTHFLLRLGNHASGALSRGVWGPRRAVKRWNDVDAPKLLGSVPSMMFHVEIGSRLRTRVANGGAEV